MIRSATYLSSNKYQQLRKVWRAHNTMKYKHTVVTLVIWVDHLAQKSSKVKPEANASLRICSRCDLKSPSPFMIANVVSLESNKTQSSVALLCALGA